MGPTASGKTELAVELVQRLPLEIISVDSALVYRGMDIGTAKPDAELLQRAPHRLIDIVDPVEVYSAAAFRQDALQAMAEITEAGNIPLLVGGSMLYFRALEHGLAELPAADPVLRARLDAEMRVLGIQKLHQRLQQLDAVSAAKIHPNDPQRVLRALEVISITGRPLSELQAERQAEPLPFRLLKLVRAPRERAQLHQRIALALSAHAGRRALNPGGGRPNSDAGNSEPGKPFPPSMPALVRIFRQMIKYLQGECSREEMIERGIIATRQLAKRQFTWLRADKELIWLDEEVPDLLGQARELIVNFIDHGAN